MVYLEHVAEAYERAKMEIWAPTTLYNLTNGPYRTSGQSASVYQSGYHFKANSSGRLYYDVEVSGNNASLDVYDINTQRYVGSYVLRDTGDSIYARTGYVPGLSTASNQYYSVGLTTTGPEPFNTYNVAVSWNSL